jgi:hypothetical protein
MLTDRRRGLIAHEGAPSFYADDYLDLPVKRLRLEQHLPDVRGTYRPCSRRAIQARCTETPPDAARQFGPPLPLVGDSGSPPHASQAHGDLRIRMESYRLSRRGSAGSHP